MKFKGGVVLFRMAPYFFKYFNFSTFKPGFQFILFTFAKKRINEKNQHLCHTNYFFSEL